ncbi:hypothetical protein D3C80_1326790 [compost metagenome]
MVFDWHRHAGVSVYSRRADGVYLRAGVQQRNYTRAAKSGRPGHAACYLADGDDCADYRAGESGVRGFAGVAGDAI